MITKNIIYNINNLSYVTTATSSIISESFNDVQLCLKQPNLQLRQTFPVNANLFSLTHVPLDPSQIKYYKSNVLLKAVLLMLPGVIVKRFYGLFDHRDWVYSLAWVSLYYLS